MSARSCGCDPQAQYRCAEYPVCAFATELDTVCRDLGAAYIAFPMPKAGNQQLFDVHCNPDGTRAPLRHITTNIEMDGR